MVSSKTEQAVSVGACEGALLGPECLRLNYWLTLNWFTRSRGYQSSVS
jgi:hypothetical protein